MAIDFLNSLNLNRVAQLLNARKHNVTSAERATLAGELGAAHSGLFVWDTDEKMGYTWDGAQFVPEAVAIEGDVIFRGVLEAVDYDQTDPGYTTGPEERAAGSEYVVGEAGTLDIDGVTSYSPSAAVEAGDRILFTAPDTVYVQQRNDEQATESALGNVRLASQPEADAGSNAQKVITPATLQGKLVGKQYVRGFFATVSTTALTPANINHGLGLVDKDAFTINVMDSSGSQVSVDVDSVDADNLTITTLLAQTDIKVTITGFAAA